LTLGWLDQLPHLGLIDGGWECQHGAEASAEHTHTHTHTSRRTGLLAERTYVSDCSWRGLGIGAQTESFKTDQNNVGLHCGSAAYVTTFARPWFITFKTEREFEWHLFIVWETTI